jgi:hypothetical protein
VTLSSLTRYEALSIKDLMEEYLQNELKLASSDKEKAISDLTKDSS